MVVAELFINYWRWHYSLAIKDIFSIWGNFIWFLWNYFSIKQLTQTFFVPWRRLGESSPSVFRFFEFFSSIIITFLMRLVGVVVRFAVIMIGLTSIVFAVFLGLGVLVAWIFMPLIILFILIYEIKPV